MPNLSPDETRRLIEAADGALVGVTDGEWLFDEGCIWGESITDEVAGGPPCYGIPIADVRGDHDRRWGRRLHEGEREANARFIAYARTGVPALSAECARLLAENGALRTELETAASALTHATDLIEKHVPPDALGSDSSGDLEEAHLTWSWPILDEYIYGLREVVKRVRALLARASGV